MALRGGLRLSGWPSQVIRVLRRLSWERPDAQRHLQRLENQRQLPVPTLSALEARTLSIGIGWNVARTCDALLAVS